MQISNIKNTRFMLESLEEKAKNRTVAIFPEGTRTLDGKLNSFYRGFIYLLRATENDILPVTLNGFYKLKPKNRFSIHFGSRLGMVIHTPLEGGTLARLTDREIMDKVTEVIESENTDLDSYGK
jgi:1-acyl-sn-glycerol-3-phosphate acyltransferase